MITHGSIDSYRDNLEVEYAVERISRSARTKCAFIIHFRAHNLFRVVADLERILGSIQHPMQLAVPLKSKDTRPWYFGFVRDTVWASDVHDGELGLRLYVNDETISEYFDKLCDASYPRRATVTLEQ